MNEKKCELCKYYKEGTCYVMLWANGRQAKMGNVPGNGKCDLWEAKEICVDENNMRVDR